MRNVSKYRLIPAIVLIGGLFVSAAQAVEDQEAPFRIQRVTAVLQQSKQTERKFVRRKKTQSGKKRLHPGEHQGLTARANAHLH